MKWILIILLICLIMLIAWGISEQYKERFDFYTNLKLFLENYKLNLSFRKEKLYEFLSQQTHKKQFKNFIEDYISYINTNELNLSNLTILTEDEKEQLSEIIVNLGKFDAKNELNQAACFIAEVNEKLKMAEDEKKKLCPMILKLSLLFAIGLSIILI